MRDFLAATRDRVVVFDGGMGATLEQFDLSLERDYQLPGRCHEALVLNRPDVIQGVHESMVEAGAEVVETDTFQASRLKLDEWGLAEHTLEINRRAAEIARKAVGEDRFVAGSIGPTGFLPASEDPSLGQIRFRELVEVFTEQSKGLLEGGVDLLIVETAQDILEVKAAIFGMREAFKLTGRSVPIQASVSLLPNGGKMLLGTDISAALATLEALKVDVIGLNCSTGPEDMRDAIRFLGEYSPLPVHCIPNAGIPHQGPDGETIFPEQPEPLAEALGEFVERYGVGDRRRLLRHDAGPHPRDQGALRVASGLRAPRRRARRTSRRMIAAAPLVQEPAPTIVGERVNSQGSRKAKELLLADDYDGLLQVAEDQVEGGAHVLDLCVALTERQRRGRADAARGQEGLAHAARADPGRLDRARGDRDRARPDPGPRDRQLGQPRGRRGQAQPRRPDRDGARRRADRADDRRGRHGQDPRAQARGRQADHGPRLRRARDGPRAADLRRAHVHAHDRRRGVEAVGGRDDRGHPADQVRAARREDVARRLQRQSFGIGLPARSVLNSVFLHHCVEAGLDLAMVNPNHITPYGEIPEAERALADDLVFNRRDDALEIFIQHFEAKGPEAEAEAADPTAGMEPEEALHWHILRRKRDGVEDQIDASVEKIGAVPTLNDVLLPAMKEVGDKFGAGELILPFVLQSAEVMKRAVAQLEKYLEKLEGYTKGTVVLATVFGDVHDIGKSLVNTILTNNGYTVVDLGKQVPIQTILDAAKEHKATAIGLSALLVSHLQADAARRPGAAPAGARLPRAARRRRDQPQVRAARAVPGRQGVRDVSTTRASSTARTRSRAWP